MYRIFILILISFWSCSNHQAQNNSRKIMKESPTHKHTNKLINQTSPYLLQHAHNPVNWYPWGDTAFDKAKKENKLVLVSIGYAACHWCHVMEHQSFENEEIAQIMNDNFICIKVDREERPDIDQIYMSAVQLLTGSGGWPLNCFTLPDGRPIYGGTYFNSEQWVQVLTGLNQTFKDSPQRILDAADEISAGVKSHELIDTKQTNTEFSAQLLKTGVESWSSYFDKEWGGNKGAPKFPMPSGLELLLAYGHITKNQELTEHVNFTLQKIAYGGIYDQVGGGFARYSVDAQWKVPHFEKMLYDNGQLVSLFCNAFKVTNSQLLKQTVEQTLGFVSREMTHNNGAFYASFDADSEGVEGKYYVWTKGEIEKILDTDSEWFCDYYNVTKDGNWEHSNILWVTKANAIIEKHNLSPKELEKLQDKTLSKLLKERNKRIPPGLDDKILTSWNALMSMGYFDAYEALNDENYLDIALTNCKFIEETMLQANGEIYRNHKNGTSNINGFLDDYALSIQLFTKAYASTFDEHWLNLAEGISNYVIKHFYDTKSGMFFYTSDQDKELIARKMELSDNVIPASNSIMANNLYDLSILLNKNEWKEISIQMLANVKDNLNQNIAYYSNWGILLNKLTNTQYEVVFVGENATTLKQEFDRKYHPNVLIAGSLTENNTNVLTKNRWVKNETLIYVCKNNSCRLPVKSVSEVLQLLK